MRVHPRYLALATILFLVEVAIARRILPGTFVRNNIGDLLVIPLLYFLLRGLTQSPPTRILWSTFALSLITELLQALHLADHLGLQPGSLPYTLLGNTFSYTDLLMYGLGGLLALWLDLHLIQPHTPH